MVKILTKSKKPTVSIIIRTKNEERWITSCLRSVFAQDFNDFEVIIVDNASNDKTIKKAKSFPIQKVINIDQYLPGKALNLGISNSNGKYIVCLSAHCIPITNKWLSTLLNAIKEDEKYAGVYGRQEPMSFSTPADKRDLLIVFGLDRKIQINDSFFHNANSIIQKKIWEKIPFDDKTTNIEDRLWAQEIVSKDYKILYEPDASVYHYHGIHQTGNVERLDNVVKIIENQRQIKERQGKLEPDSLKIAAFIPVKGRTRSLAKTPQICYTIESAQRSKYIDKIFVSTDSKETAKISVNSGAECPFIRPKSLSEPHVNLEMVQQFTLNKVEELGYLPDLIVHLEETFPFREEGLFDGMIINLLREGYDSVVAAQRESGWLWQELPDGEYIRLDSGDVPRKFKEKSLVGLHGLGCVTHPEFIRSGRILGNKIGLYIVNYPLASYEIRGSLDSDIASQLLKRFN
jgi:rhamnosyltransferase